MVLGGFRSFHVLVTTYINNLWEGCTSRVRVCLLVLHIIFRTRKYKNRPLKSIPVFRPGLYSEIISSLFTLAPPPKNKQILQDAFRVRSYSLGIEMINTLTLYPFIDSVPTSKTIPREPYLIPDQNGQSVYPFSGLKGPKTLPDVAA